MVDVLHPRPGEAFLDVAGGTGDIAFRILQRLGSGRAGADVTICDINPAMLEVGRDRAVDRGLLKGLTWTTGDAESLPFPDRSFDAYTIAFGLRNVTDIDKALGEAFRVLRPGGRFLCLEFSKVTSAPIGRAYDAYSERALPLLGRVIARDAESYRYLHESIRRFPSQRDLARRMREAGFERVALAQHDARRRRPAYGLADLGMLRALRNSWRLLRVALSFARHDALFPLETLGIAPALIAWARLFAWRRDGRRPGERLAAALQEMGPSFIKLGQALSTRADLLSEEVASRSRPAAGPPAGLLRRGGARAPSRPSSASRSRRCSRASTTCRSPPPRSRRCISPSPPTAAPVAVKVLRPGIEAAFARDLDLFYWMAELVERTQPRFRRLKPVEVGARPSPTWCGSRWTCAWRPRRPQELGENFADDPDYRAPEIDWDRTAQRVMTLEQVDGIPIGDRDAIIAAGHDPDVDHAEERRGVLLPGVPRRLLPCRHARRQRLRRPPGLHRAGRLRHHGPGRRGHARLSRRAAGRLPAARLSRGRRGAVPRRLRAGRPVDRDVRPGLPLDRRADLRQALATRSRSPACWRSCCASPSSSR